MSYSSMLFAACSHTSLPITNPTIPSLLFSTPSYYQQYQQHQQLKQPKKRRQLLGLCTSYEVGGGYPDAELGYQGTSGSAQQKMDASQYEAILKGGEQVTSVLEEMITLVSFFCFSFLKVFIFGY
jgi:hypothetical protein